MERKAVTLRESLARKLGQDALARVESVRVGIAGAGGLGSNLASCLVRAGFRKLRVVDFDVVAAPDLDRQFYFARQVGMRKIDALGENLLEITPGLDLELEEARIEKGMFSRTFAGCHVVAECLDLPEDKAALVSELVEAGTFVVAVSGLGGFGSSDGIRVHRVLDNLVVIGDLLSDAAGCPPLSPRTTIAAAKQADAILEYVAGKGPGLLP